MTLTPRAAADFKSLFTSLRPLGATPRMTALLRVLVATVAAAAAAASHADLVVNYEFNGPAGPLSSATNSGSGTIAPWAADPDATLNGIGQLVVTGPLGFQAQPLAIASQISSGTAFMRIDFSSWGPSADQFFVFGMRARTPSTMAAQSWRLQFQTGNANADPPTTGRIGEVALHSFNDGFNSLGTGLPVVGGPNTSMPNGLSVIMGLDLDNDTTSVWWDPNRTGTYEIIGMRENLAIDSTNGFTNFNLIDALQMQSSGGPFAIDRLALGTNFAQISAIPEASPVFVLGALSVAMAWVSLRARRAARRIADGPAS